jgi:hypothetical protein
MKNFTLIALCAMLFSTGSLVAQSPIFTEGYASGVTFAAFGGSVNNISEDATEAYSGSKSLKIVVPGGDYTGGAMVAATPQDLSTYNAVSFWVKASAAKTLNVAGIGNDALTNVYQSEYKAIPVTTTWTKVVIPIPNPAKFTSVVGLFHFAEGADEGVYTIWMDDVQYETTTVGTATAAMATETITKSIGDSFSPNGVTCSFNGVSFEIMKAWFNYTSSNMGVATMNNATGVGSVVGAGTTNITATMGATVVTGTLTVNVSAAPVGPTVAAPTPTRAAGDVTSLFSNAYTNVSVDTWSAVWDAADVADVMIAGNETKKYTNHTFSGIEFVGPNLINATARTHFHLDVWTADAAGTDGFKVKLVDFGANGVYQGMPNDDSESIELPFTATASGWFAVDVPLSSFTGLTNRANLAQLVLVTPGGGKTFWLDNVYLYTAAVPPTAPMVAAPTPTLPAANVISMFSGAYTDVATEWNPNWGQSTVYSEVMIAGNPTKKYDNLNFQGAVPASLINATAATKLHVDIWTPTDAIFRIKLVDFGADLAGGGGDDKEHELAFPVLGGVWTALDPSLSDFTTLTSRAHIGQFIISSPTVVARALAGPTFFMDNVYFYSSSPLAVDLTNLTAKSVNKTTVLNWQTASEKDNQGFTVERSLNGTDYAAIGQVKGFGTTNTVRNYTFTDVTPTNGVNYYRLRQADFNGKETLSKVVSVISGKNFLVLKNTLVQNLLDVTVGEDQKGPLSIFNVSGQLVYSAKVQGNQLLDVSALTSGLYIVRTEAGDMGRFVKE